MECSASHDTCEMIEVYRSDKKWELTIRYSCPTCNRIVEYIYDRLIKYGDPVSIKVIQEGYYEKKAKEEGFEQERKKGEESEEKKRIRLVKKDEWEREERETAIPIIECANEHLAVKMLYIKSRYDAKWYQCPQCYAKKLITNQEILDEKKGLEWERKCKEEEKKKLLQEQKRLHEEQKTRMEQKEIEKRKIQEQKEKVRIKAEKIKDKTFEMTINDIERNFKKFNYVLMASFGLFFVEIIWFFANHEFHQSSDSTVVTILFIIGSIIYILAAWELMGDFHNILRNNRLVVKKFLDKAKEIECKYRPEKNKVFIKVAVVNLILCSASWFLPKILIRDFTTGDQTTRIICTLFFGCGIFLGLLHVIWDWLYYNIL